MLATPPGIEAADENDAIGENLAAEATGEGIESPRPTSVRDESRPVDTGGGTEPSEVELERGILDAMRIGLIDVARTLAARLEVRRGAGTVVNLAAERERRR